MLSCCCTSQAWNRDDLDPLASGFGHIGFVNFFGEVYYCWAISQEVCEENLPVANLTPDNSEVACAPYISIADGQLFCFDIDDD